jgi:hypothetical protein
MIVGDDSTLDSAMVGGSVDVQPDNGLSTPPPLFTTTADTPSQIMELASYGVTSQPQLTIPPYQPSTPWTGVGMAVEGAIRGFFNQLPQAIGIQAPPPAPAPNPLSSISPLLLIGGAVAVLLLMRRK